MARCSQCGQKECCGASLEAENETLHARVETAEAQLAKIEKALSDSTYVHAAMLTGRIAKISWRQHCHLTGEVLNGEDVQLAEIVRLREQLAKVRELPRFGICNVMWDEDDGDYTYEISSVGTGPWVCYNDIQSLLTDKAGSENSDSAS